jgi:dihydrofolate reductase
VTRGDQALSWQNSHRVASLDALAGVKQGEGPDLVIQGSSTLYPQLLAAGLIDRLVLMTFPLVLGRGKRLFGDGTIPQSMRMVDHEVSARGNIIATYEPGDAVEPGSFGSIEPGPLEIERRDKMAQGRW